MKQVDRSLSFHRHPLSSACTCNLLNLVTMSIMDLFIFVILLFPSLIVCGVRELLPQEEVEVLKIWETICKNGEQGELQDGTPVYCKSDNTPIKVDVKLPPVLLESGAPPDQIIFVQPPSHHYKHDIVIQGGGVVPPKTKIFVTPVKSTHEVQVKDGRDLQTEVQKPQVFFLGRSDHDQGQGKRPPVPTPSPQPVTIDTNTNGATLIGADSIRREVVNPHPNEVDDEVSVGESHQSSSLSPSSGGASTNPVSLKEGKNGQERLVFSNENADIQNAADNDRDIIGNNTINNVSSLLNSTIDNETPILETHALNSETNSAQSLVNDSSVSSSTVTLLPNGSSQESIPSTTLELTSTEATNINEGELSSSSLNTPIITFNQAPTPLFDSLVTGNDGTDPHQGSSRRLPNNNANLPLFRARINFNAEPQLNLREDETISNSQLTPVASIRSNVQNRRTGSRRIIKVKRPSTTSNTEESISSASGNQGQLQQPRNINVNLKGSSGLVQHIGPCPVGHPDALAMSCVYVEMMPADGMSYSIMHMMRRH